jgi:hypothetical protein
MAAPKGTRPPAAGQGRKPGSKNKAGANVAAAILRTLDKAGGDAYLLKLANDHPRVFGMLLGKLMPTQLTGADGEPVKFQAVGDQAALMAMRGLIEQARAIGAPPPAEPPAPEPMHH